MKYVLIALVVVVQVWSAVAAPRPFSVDVTSFDEFVSQAQVKVQSASYRLKEMLNLPKDTKALAVFEAIKNNTEKFTKEVSDVVSKIRKQIQDTENSETVKNIHDKLEKTIESLREELKSSDIKEKTKLIQENFAKSLNVIVEEAGKLSKAATADTNLSEDLHSLSLQVVDQAVKAANTVQSAVHDVIHRKSDDQDQ